MNGELEAATIRICNNNVGVAGAGLLIDESHFLTCAHVLNYAQGRLADCQRNPEGAFQVDFPLVAPNLFLLTEVVEWHPRQQNGTGDIAVLRLTQDVTLPSGTSPAWIIPITEVNGHQCHAYGYPQHYEIPGRWSKGILSKQNQLGWFQIDSQNSQENFISKGFSGGGVWDEKLKGVIGIVVAADEHIKLSTMISIDQLCTTWTPLRSIISENLKKRWFAWEIEQRVDVQQDLVGYLANNEHETSLQRHWQQFITQPGWHETQRKQVGRIIDQAAKHPTLQWLVSALNTVDWSARYGQILLSLREIRLDQALSDVSEIIRKLEETKRQPTNHSPAHEDESANLDPFAIEGWQQLRRHLHALRIALENPEFSRCFLVLGSFGAGKTYFIHSLLSRDQSHTKEHLVIPLRPTISPLSLEQMILKAISEASKSNIPTLAAFNQILEIDEEAGRERHHSPPVRLVLAIDDLQEWERIRPSFKNELIDFVDRHTHLHSLSWVIALQDTHYEMAVQSSKGFWKAYGFNFSAIKIARSQARFTPGILVQTPSIGNWVVLDDVNRILRTGSSILKRELDLDQLSLDFASDTDPSLRLISNPFIAIILLALRSELKIERLMTLNYIQFVSRFWELRALSLDCSSINLNQLKAAIYFITYSMARSGEVAPLLTRLVNEVVALAQDRSELQKRALTETAIETFVQANLLARVGIESQEIPDLVEERILLKFETFWELHLARRYREDESLINIGVRNAIAAWQDRIRAMAVDHIRDGTYEFFLLLMSEKDSQGRQPDEALITQLWFWGLEQDGSIASSVWFAGVKGTETTQHLLVNWIQTNPDKRWERRALQGYLQFLTEVRSNLLATPDRFHMAQAHYQSIKDTELVEYFTYLTACLMDQIGDTMTLVKCLPHFTGCEVMGNERELAELAVSALWQLAEKNPDAALNTIFVYVKHESRAWSKRNADGINTEQWVSRTFRQWILFHFTHLVVNTLGLRNAYLFFERADWWSRQKAGSSIHRHIWLEMEREATISLGYRYRIVARREIFDSDKPSKEAVTLANPSDRIGKEASEMRIILSRLVDKGKKRDRELAFHIIRHTRPAIATEKTVVDSTLQPYLLAIYEDKQLVELRDKFKGFFEENLRNEYQ